MAEIKSTAMIKGRPLLEVKCPICQSLVSHYDLMPILEIDFDDIAKQLDELRAKKFQERSDIKIIIEIENSSGNRIFGYPVKFRCQEK